ncbi:50S ribosomal protein L3 [candidate division WOR-3 bacterium]|uniref:Large ribosomal subunit protein uL3 n=1 Tax=candidate division WOR-3 bacterium TaxID=2052148 RepID=A0A937XDF0_UNCW3|nr:50S ribosomal protein L3 [candidate division WOR-3 bacterium]
MKALIGQKGIMAQLYDERGVVVPATEVKVGECVVVGKRTQELNGYEALQIGFGAVSKRKSKKSLLGFYKKAGVPPARSLQEILVDKIADYHVGQKLGVDVFALGDRVHVTGITRGRGFTGGMKRWGWHGGPASHGSMFSRRIGSLGSGTTPGRPLKGRTGAGHYGVEQVTIRNLSIVKLDREKGVLYVNGAIPGFRGSLVLIRKRA